MFCNGSALTLVKYCMWMGKVSHVHAHIWHLIWQCESDLKGHRFSVWTALSLVTRVVFVVKCLSLTHDHLMLS